jgi:hypothetical protein
MVYVSKPLRKILRDNKYFTEHNISDNPKARTPQFVFRIIKLPISGQGNAPHAGYVGSRVTSKTEPARLHFSSWKNASTNSGMNILPSFPMFAKKNWMGLQELRQFTPTFNV